MKNSGLVELLMRACLKTGLSPPSGTSLRRDEFVGFLIGTAEVEVVVPIIELCKASMALDRKFVNRSMLCTMKQVSRVCYSVL